jgi:ABC-type sugar transport system ATPase subunit
MSENDIALAGVHARGLTKSYGPLHAVRGIDLSIAPGDTVALLGPNGAGKSTTIDMILDLSDSRTVSVFGQPPDHAVRAGAIGAVLQTGVVAQYLSVRELLGVAFQDMQIGAADGSRVDPDDGVGIIFDLRVRNILPRRHTRSVINRRLHHNLRVTANLGNS